jgi:hypothetical protein
MERRGPRPASTPLCDLQRTLAAPRSLTYAPAVAALASRWLLLGVPALTLGACIATSPQGIHRQTDDNNGGAGGESLHVDDKIPPENPVPGPPTSDPHAVIGAQPSHGPFAGGQRVLIHGKGFSSKAKVWFGDVEVDPKTVLPVDPGRVQVGAPPGKAGAVDITVQNGDDASTRRTLAGAYTYDALYATPNSGPVSGGTVIEIIGQDNAWDASSVAKIDQIPCVAITVKSPTSLSCTVPSGTPGSKTISVTTGSETEIVLDGYTYEDSENGYKGGLSGAPLAGQLKVLALDNFTGVPLPGAHVIVGAPISEAIVAQTNPSGVAVVNDPSLTGPRTVTVASYCHSPITFVDNPVDTVTAYLDPVLDPTCASMGDPPPVGGKPIYTGNVQGELVWPASGEFKKGLWSNVPAAVGSSERRAAYVFVAQGDPTSTFQLPSSSSAVTEESPGGFGYSFSISVSPGNRALYALAGIEDRSQSPPRFTAYVMGVVKGVPVLPNAMTPSVYLSMTKTLDQTLTLDVKPPPPGAKGPDRLRATVAVMLGNDGFAVFPISQKTPLLPISGLLPFVGVPALDGDLAGAVYVATTRAQTGPTGTAPLSAIGNLTTTTTSQPLSAKGFVTVPTLVTPAVNSAWDGTHLATTFPSGGEAIDLSVYDIQSGNGLVHWLVSVPQGSHAVEVPDLRGFPDSSLPPGPLTIGVFGARINGFHYGQLLYRNLRPQGMTAYSLDYFSAHL